MKITTSPPAPLLKERGVKGYIMIKSIALGEGLKSASKQAPLALRRGVGGEVSKLSL